jgi:hypothetical protein
VTKVMAIKRSQSANTVLGCSLQPLTKPFQGMRHSTPDSLRRVTSSLARTYLGTLRFLQIPVILKPTVTY